MGKTCGSEVFMTFCKMGHPSAMCRSAPPRRESLQNPRRGGTPCTFQVVRHYYKVTMYFAHFVNTLMEHLLLSD